MDYKSYTVEDFVLNKKFRSWVLKPSAEMNFYWEKVIKEHPEKIQEIKEAINITANIHEFNYKVSPERSRTIWDYINKHTDQHVNEIEEHQKVIPLNSRAIVEGNIDRNRNRTQVFLKYAAIITLILISTLVLYLTTNNHGTSEDIQVSEWVIKKNPWGQKSTIFLSDGSEVILNAGSTLKYTENFSDTERALQLEGEAFFTVSKDSLRPFRVYSNGVMTEALGTSFNVKAYPYEPIISVALATGKVQVTQLTGKRVPFTLEPGQQLEYDQENDHTLIAPFDSRETLSWKSGIIYFKNASEQQVFARLEQWYGVKFHINNSPHVKKWTYTAEFANKSLENVLQSISFSMDFGFTISNKNVVINYN